MSQWALSVRAFSAGLALSKASNSFDVAADRGPTSGHSRVGGEDETGVAAALRSPSPCDDGEIGDVVRDERPAIGLARGEAQRFAGLLPSAPRMAARTAPASCGTMSRSLWCSGRFNRDAAATALPDPCRH